MTAFVRVPLSAVVLQVSLWIPIVFVLVCVFLLVVPCVAAPYEVGIGIAITLTGIPVFLIGVQWEDKPKVLSRSLGT